MKIMKNIQSMYQKQFCIEKYADLLLIGKEGKRHVFIKDLNTFMYDQRLHRAKKNIFAVIAYKLFKWKK